MEVQALVQNFKDKNIKNTRVDEHAVENYVKQNVTFKTYIPFRQKRRIAEMVVAKSVRWVDGVKKNDQIEQFIAFIVAMITAHTDLEFSNDPVADYDLLAESNLLPIIITEFKQSYDESEIILKMLLSMEMEDNNTNAIVARFLNGVLDKLNDVGDVLKASTEGIDMGTILKENFKSEDLAKLSSFLNTYNN
jgi:hypothetical protein